MITLECNYSKKIGLPQYSSHQFSITLRTDLADVTQVQAESSRLYELLQNGVDASIQEVGFLPNGTGNSNGHNGNGHLKPETWNCSDKQKDLITKIVTDQKLERGVCVLSVCPKGDSHIDWWCRWELQRTRHPYLRVYENLIHYSGFAAAGRLREPTLARGVDAGASEGGGAPVGQ